MKTNILYNLIALISISVLVSCGDSGFVVQESDDLMVEEGSTDDNGAAATTDSKSSTNSKKGSNGSNEEDELIIDKDYTTLDPKDLENPDIDVTLPDDLEEADKLALKRCLLKWKNNPFGNNINYVRKISAAVTVGGVGNAVNDTETTSEPELVLIVAGVNVLGTPVYNLRNDKGYYCIETNVNVLSDLSVNLACHSRLADNSVNVNVGSYQEDVNTSGIGVHVGSTINLQRLTPSGSDCYAK